MTHLYRHFNGGRLFRNLRMSAYFQEMRDMEYLGYVSLQQYDGNQYHSFTAAPLASERLLPTRNELRNYGCA